MADTKISDMTAATVVQNAAIIPIVQAGANLKATRALLLTAGTGEDLILKPAATKGVYINGTVSTVFLGIQEDDEVIGIGDVATLGVNVGGLVFAGIEVANDGTVFTWFPDSGCQGWFGNASIDRGLYVDPDGLLVGLYNPEGCYVEWIDSTPANWASAPPPDMQEALQRLALAVAGLLGTAIP